MMTSPFRFETKLTPYAVEAGMPSVDVEISLYCGEVLLDQRSRDFCETDKEVQEAIEALTEELSSRLGHAVKGLMQKEGYTF